jgi:hypothetical protein
VVTDIENAHLLTDQGIGRRDDAQHVQAPAKPGIGAFAQGLNCESRTLEPLGLFAIFVKLIPEFRVRYFD